MRDRPNIVVILTDDQGPWTLGCAGNHEIVTPNLDRLASAGTRFENFFCPSPVCSPARASLLTGYMPSAHGILDWLHRGNIDSDVHGIGDGDSAVEYLEGLAGYTDLLAQAGYTIGLSGKWHLGDSARPQKSFSHWFAHSQSGGHYYVDAPMLRDGVITRQQAYLTDAITDDAVEFVRGRKDRGPFCCEVHYTAPHSPWVGCHPEELVRLYKDCPFESCPDLPAHPWQVASAPRGSGERRKEILRGYYAAITGLDRGAGRIIETLEALNMREDTVVFFLSDNGMCMGHHGIFGKGNGTFPQNMFEESVKVPAIVSCPGTVVEGVVCEGMYSHYDWFPTVAELCELDVPDNRYRPGVSFADVLRGNAASARREVVVYDEYGPVRMIRDREWKYVHRYPYGPHELYNLAADPGEVRNLVDSPETAHTVKSLRDKLEAFFIEYSSPLIDGSRQPVTGNGQVDRVGPRGSKPHAFNSRHHYIGNNGEKRGCENRWGLFPDPLQGRTTGL